MVSATNLAASTDTATAETTNRTYQESDAAITYSGSWENVAADLDNGSSARYLNSTGSAKLSFSGTAVSWISRTSPTSGTNSVYIDGVKVATVDRYSATKRFNIPVFTKTGLTSGAHTIEVRWTGAMNSASTTANLLFDAFVVTTATATATDTGATPAALATGTGAAKLVLESVIAKGITVSWVKATTSPTAYEIKRSSDGSNYTTIARVSSSTTAYFDVSTKPGVRMTYKVSAVSSSGSTTSTSATVSAVAKSIPTGNSRRYSSCPSATKSVSTASALKSALYNATAGTVIKLAPGTYTGTFSASKSGTTDRPIWICGPRTAIITSGSYRSGHAFSMENKHDIVLAGMTIRNSFKGVTVISSQRITVTDLLVENIGYEAIHLRSQTLDSEVKYNTIRKTGLVMREFGEGIYIGTSDSNWCKYNGCQPDRTDRTLVLGNTISETGAQAIEAKAGTSNGVIARNNIVGYSPGSSYGEGWVLIKGNDWFVGENTGRNSPDDGYATNGSVTGWGKYNVFARNSASNTADYGLWIHLPNNVDLRNKVSCNNSTSSTSDGAMNVTCMK